MTIREKASGVEKVSPKAHTVQTTYSGDDIALGVTYQVAIGERRTIVVQTHVGQSDSEADINKLFDKVMKVTDRVHAKYRIEELRLNLKREMAQLALSMTNLSDTKNRWAKEWVDKNKRGPFTHTGDQSRIESQMETQHETMRGRIKEIEIEIAELEKLVRG